MSTPFPRIGVAITAFNNVRVIEATIRSLLEQDPAPDRIVLLDDGSSDGTGEFVKATFGDQIDLLYGDGNFFWTKSVNAGIRHLLDLGMDAVIMLNADSTLDKDYLKDFAAIYQEHPDALLAPVVRDQATRNIIYTYVTLNVWTAKYTVHRTIPDSPLNVVGEDVIPSDVLFGRGLWVPASVYRRLGLLNERALPQYGSDSSFTLKAKRAKYPVYTVLTHDLFTPVDQSQVHYERKKHKISLRKYYLDKRSPTTLRVRYQVALDSAPWFYFPVYLALDLGRVFLHYLRGRYIGR